MKKKSARRLKTVDELTDAEHTEYARTGELPETEIPRRLKTVDELTVEEHIEHARTGKLSETQAYRAHRRAVLEDAGLADETPQEKSPDEQSIDDHLSHIRTYPQPGSGTSVAPRRRKRG